MRVCASLAVIVLFVIAGSAQAQFEPEPKTPYQWRVVLKAPAHPLLSSAFRQQLKRDITAALQPALGKLGTVEVVDLADVPRDNWDSLWSEFADKGFDALDAPRDLTGVKNHFLTIEYRRGVYQLASRQHDGFVGIASPVVRRQSVRVPELVGRTAGLMLYQDFGLAGTLEPTSTSPKERNVTIRGGELDSLDRFVKVGDVFAVSQVRKTNRPAPPVRRTATGKIIEPEPGSVPPPGFTANVRAHTLLRVSKIEGNGKLRCDVFTKYENPTVMGGDIVGYRCLKLGTVKGPIQLQLVTSDPAAQGLVGNVNVRATESGFDAAPEIRDQLTYKDGVFRSSRDLDQLACVTLARTGLKPAQFAIPVIGTEPIELPYELNPDLERKAEHLQSVLATAARVADARNAQAICFDATAKLIEKQKNAEALARAKGGLQAATAIDESVKGELTRLREHPDQHPNAAKYLAGIEQQLASLRQFNQQLEAHVKTLEEVVRRENDPTIAARELQAEQLSTTINLKLSTGDIEEAINAYDQLVTLLPEGSPEHADAKNKRDKLKADWALKSPAHAQAREYLLKKWPAVSTIPDFKDSLEPVKKAVQECMTNGDPFTLRKFRTYIVAAGVKLNDLVRPLDPNSDADRKLAADANTAGEQLAALEIEIVEFLKKE